MHAIVCLVQRIWRKVRSLFGRSNHESEATSPMTAREFEALKGIARKGAAAHPAWLAVRLGVSVQYVRVLCATLVREDYADVTPDGLYTLSAKGRRELFARGVFKQWEGEALELLPPEVRQKLAHELADEIKKEVGSTVQDFVERLPRRARGVGEPAEEAEIQIRTDYSFLPPEGARLEHTLGTRAEKECTGRADKIEEAAKAFRRLGKKNS